MFAAVSDHAGARMLPDGASWLGDWTQRLHAYRAEARPCADSVHAVRAEAERAAEVEARFAGAAEQAQRHEAEARDAESESRRLASEHRGPQRSTRRGRGGAAQTRPGERGAPRIGPKRGDARTLRRQGSGDPHGACRGRWAELSDELQQRERTLSAEQRRIFGETLLDEIAEHLRERIGRVRDQVDDMNATLAGRAAGSGRTVQLDWRPRADTDFGEGLQDVLRLLRRSVATLSEEERAPLIEFFRDCVQRARDSVEGAGGAAEQLRQAFDYRAWFDFDLIEVKDGHRTRLTAKRHRENLCPADAGLNLAAEKHSHGLRRLAAIESCARLV